METTPKMGTPEFDRLMAKAIEEDGESVVFGSLTQMILSIARNDLAEKPVQRKQLAKKIGMFEKDLGILIFDTYDFTPVEAILALGHGFLKSMIMFFMCAARVKEMKSEGGEL